MITLLKSTYHSLTLRAI